MSRPQAPPQNVSAEESVLGALLVTESALAPVIDEVGLTPQDFGFDKNGIIFNAIHDLYAAGEAVDELTVAEALNKRDQMEAAGGQHRVSELAAKVAAPGNAKHHAELVRKDGQARAVIAASRRAIDAAQKGSLNGEARDLVTQLERSVNGIHASEIKTTKGSDIRMRAPRFIDSASMILRRSINVGVGPAGLGKTIYACGQSAAVSAGRMKGLDGPQQVLISSQEDDPEAVLAPRLTAAGADLDRVHFVSGLSLPSQVPALAARAKTLGAVFVVIDPIAAHLDPGIDSHRDAATRAALAPLAEMATDLDLAVLVIAHPNKSTGASGLDRISGSGAFGNAARSVIVFGADPTDPEGDAGPNRIIAHLKCNVAKRSPSIAATIETTKVETEDGPTSVPRLKITGLSNHSAADVLASPTAEERTERGDAKTFLAELLSGGPVRTKELEAAAGKAEVKWRTVERAKSDLDLKAVKGPDGWYWLPEGREEL